MHSLKITTPLNNGNQTSTTPRLRNKTSSSSNSSGTISSSSTKPRQRPKTIHVDTQEISESLALVNSRGKKGSSSNLSGDDKGFLLYCKSVALLFYHNTFVCVILSHLL